MNTFLEGFFSSTIRIFFSIWKILIDKTYVLSMKILYQQNLFPPKIFLTCKNSYDMKYLFTWNIYLFYIKIHFHIFFFYMKNIFEI